MGDDEQRAASGDEIGREPADALDVEMVGRFVEHQQIGLLHQGFGDSDAPPLAAGQPRDVGVEADRGQAEAGEHLAHGRVTGPFVLGAVAHDYGADARTRRQVAALVDGRHPHPARAGDPSTVGLLGSGDHPQQGGLAAAVAADHTDPFAVGDPE